MPPELERLAGSRLSSKGYWIVIKERGIEIIFTIEFTCSKYTARAFDVQALRLPKKDQVDEIPRFSLI